MRFDQFVAILENNNRDILIRVLETIPINRRNRKLSDQIIKNKTLSCLMSILGGMGIIELV